MGEFYVIYDLKDNIVAYADDKKELSNFTGLRSRDVNFRFKNRHFILTTINGFLYKVYRFFDEVVA